MARTVCKQCNYTSTKSPCTMCRDNAKYQEEHKEEIAARIAALPETDTHCGHKTKIGACICHTCFKKGITHESLQLTMCK